MRGYDAIRLHGADSDDAHADCGVCDVDTVRIVKSRLFGGFFDHVFDGLALIAVILSQDFSPFFS